MENVLETLYYEWADNLEGDTKEVKEAFKKINEYENALRSALSDDFLPFDDAIMYVASTSQKQGFMAGFEIARQLLTGGSHGAITSI